MKSTSSAKSRPALAISHATSKSSAKEAPGASTDVTADNATATAAALLPPSAAEAARQQALVATDAACAVFRGFEAIRKVQEQAARDALNRHTGASRKLRGQTQPAELLALQAELMRSDFEAAVRYWRELTAASLEMQAELVSCTTQLVDSETVIEETAAVKTLPSVPPLRWGMPGMQALFNTMTAPFLNPAGKDDPGRTETS